MAIFGLKKKKEKEAPGGAITEGKEVKEKAPKQVRVQKREAVLQKDVLSVLVRPRVTEKATQQSEKGVYVFDVQTRATKRDVQDAIFNIYKVRPIKVNVVKRPLQKVASRMRGTRGTKAGYKKAYVYLKEGDRIEII